MLVAKVQIFIPNRIIFFFFVFQENLKSAIDDKIINLTKTRIIRLRKRESLIRTRLAGAREAKGDILIFFDSHIEVNINWLPPLIEPIALNYKTSVCPFIDIIKWDTFVYIAQDEGLKKKTKEKKTLFSYFQVLVVHLIG